jgi:putative oxidoreductase
MKMILLSPKTWAASLAFLFSYVAFSKWLDMHAFKNAMHNQVFPDWFATVLVWTLPPMEVITVVLLAMKKTRATGFIFSLTQMILFTTYIIAILLHVFPRVPCGCGGVIQKFTWGQHLIFNLFFITISALGYYLTKREKTNYEDPYLYTGVA